MNGEIRFWWSIITLRFFRDVDKKMICAKEKAERVNHSVKVLLEAINNNHKVDISEDKESLIP